ncbi:MAG: HesA/MoeB/ThiF family protein [Candidatus Wallbacteria bacterium]|nr:HesA/MoeB/ThiF family protein [Candidatus Wallbacteria bacterium]
MGLERYSRQIAFSGIGLEGQKVLSAAEVVILGAGALGTNLAEQLARGGIGRVRLIDPERVELSNLQRQTLFDERDLGRLKCFAASEKLFRINSSVRLETVIVRADQHNIRKLLQGFDLVLDATDNFQARLLINQTCLELSLPWVHTAVTGACGQSLAFKPDGACFSCFMPDIPDSDDYPGVNNCGILNSIVRIMSAVSCTTALKILLGEEVEERLIVFDAWKNRFQKMKIERNPACHVCGNLTEHLRRKL